MGLVLGCGFGRIYLEVLIIVYGKFFRVWEFGEFRGCFGIRILKFRDRRSLV